MILQALKEYYDRKAADPKSNIAPPGWGKKAIPFIIVLDEQGNFISIEDTREGDGKKKIAKEFVVPQAVKKASGILANLLWDAAGYVLGVDLKKTGKQEKQKKAFIDKVKDLGEIEDLKPLIVFLESDNTDVLQKDLNYQELIEENSFVSFRYYNDTDLICHRPNVREAIDNQARPKSNTTTSICLVTGKHDEPARLHQSISGVYGAQTAGANIVSFNKSAFESFYKKQGLNSPIGEKATFAYTTALNTLLSKDSKQKLSIGDATVVFWSAQKTDFESMFTSLFKEPPKDNPDEGTQKIKSLLKSVETGAYINSEDKSLFYILGLSPNAARISIRIWRCETVGKFAANIAQYFNDMSIVKPPREPEHYSLWRVLVNIATQDKSENIPPNTAGEMMASILDGTPFPETVLQAVLRRIKSDQEFRVKPVRAALIKAYINRLYKNRPNLNPNYKEIKMSLDTTQTSSGYQLGRLFACLEKIQKEAQGETNTTIRERYYSSASTSPRTVFPILMRLKNHHLAKIEKKGIVVDFEKRLSEIIGKINAKIGFPAHLNINEQGYFAIGYYHQMQNFYTSKTETVTE